MQGASTAIHFGSHVCQNCHVKVELSYTDILFGQRLYGKCTLLGIKYIYYDPAFTIMPYIFRSDLKDNIAIYPKNQLTSSVQPHPGQTTAIFGTCQQDLGSKFVFY